MIIEGLLPIGTVDPRPLIKKAGSTGFVESVRQYQAQPESRFSGHQILEVTTCPYNTLAGILEVPGDDLNNLPLIQSSETEDRKHIYYFLLP